MADIGYLSVEEVWNLWWCTIRGGLQTLETYIVWCIMESNECNLSGTIEQKKPREIIQFEKKKLKAERIDGLSSWFTVCVTRSLRIHYAS